MTTTLISIFALIALALLNIIVYKRISRFSEMFARLCLNSLQKIFFCLDEDVKSGKITQKEAVATKKRFTTGAEKSLTNYKILCVIIWISIALTAFGMILFCVWNHVLVLPVYFLYVEAAIAVLMILSLALSSLRFKLLNDELQEKFNADIFFSEIDFAPDDLKLEVGSAIATKSEELENIMNAIKAIRAEIPALPKVRIVDNAEIEKNRYRVFAKEKQTEQGTFSIPILEEELSAMKDKIISAYISTEE